MTGSRGDARVLIVDDNAAIHDDIRKILASTAIDDAEHDALEEQLLGGTPRQTGFAPPRYRIDSAFQGRHGFARVRASVEADDPYALAIVDVRMPPGWDGVETIARLWEVCPSLQVVVCTVYSDYSWEKMTAKLGVNENLVILKKPFDNIEVLQLAHALTKKWQVTGQ